MISPIDSSWKATTRRVDMLIGPLRVEVGQQLFLDRHEAESAQQRSVVNHARIVLQVGVSFYTALIKIQHGPGHPDDLILYKLRFH